MKVDCVFIWVDSRGLLVFCFKAFNAKVTLLLLCLATIELVQVRVGVYRL